MLIDPSRVNFARTLIVIGPIEQYDSIAPVAVRENPEKIILSPPRLRENDRLFGRSKFTQFCEGDIERLKKRDSFRVDLSGMMGNGGGRSIVMR